MPYLEETPDKLVTKEHPSVSSEPEAEAAPGAGGAEAGAVFESGVPGVLSPGGGAEGPSWPLPASLSPSFFPCCSPFSASSPSAGTAGEESAAVGWSEEQSKVLAVV